MGQHRKLSINGETFYLEDGYESDDRFPDVDWYCDNCDAHLNIQESFDDHNYTHKCEVCGFRSSISVDNIF